MASSAFGVRRHHRNIHETSPLCPRMQLDIKMWIMSNTVSADSIKAQMRHPLFPVLGVTTRDIWDSFKIHPSTWCATEKRSTYQQRNPNLPQHAKWRHCPSTRRTIVTTTTNLAARKARQNTSMRRIICPPSWPVRLDYHVSHVQGLGNWLRATTLFCCCDPVIWCFFMWIFALDWVGTVLG